MERKPLDVLEAIHSTPAMRYLKPDPIPDDVLWAILDAAIRAPSGTNTQRWGWIVVRDPARKRQIAEYYRDGWRRANRIDGDGSQRKRDERFTSQKKDVFGAANYNSVEYLADHLEQAPVLIVPVVHQAGVAPGVEPGTAAEPAAFQGGPMTGSSIYGAVQNLQLAARAFGVGTTFTTVANVEAHEPDLRALLGLPRNTRTMCVIPLGYPKTADELKALGVSADRGRFFKPRRIPIDEVTHWDQWGAQKKRPAP